MAANRHVGLQKLLIIVISCTVTVIYAQDGFNPKAGDQKIGQDAGKLPDIRDGGVGMEGGVDTVNKRVPFARNIAPIGYEKDDEANGDHVNPKFKPVHYEGANKASTKQNIPGRKAVPVKIADHPACAGDVKALCSSNSVSNNFAVLDCLQGDGTINDVTENCQHFLWSYKKNLTTDVRFDSAAFEVCKETLKEYEECNMEKGTGHVISCLIDHKENVTNANCKQFLTKMSSIVFSDYRLIFKFTESCQKEITDFGCGRLHTEGDDAPHSQGKTVECLSKNVQNLGQDCKHEILRIAELQADDYHMDRPLFYACRDDRERFCHRTKSGGGKVFKCLYRHKFEKDMSSECRKKLVMRQQLMQVDYKVNKGMADACRADIKKHKCSGGDAVHTRNGRMAHILLCLEGVMKEGQVVTPECIAELQEMRRSLMEDYEISPELVRACGKEIKEGCQGGLQREGKTLHCLMDLARPNYRKNHDVTISPMCKRELEDLLKEADVGENYQMDPALFEACHPVAETACKDVKPGDARVIGCLMEKIGTNYMSDECEERLLEIQYFVSRDFRYPWKL